jgi:hypothetical protein
VAACETKTSFFPGSVVLLMVIASASRLTVLLGGTVCVTLSTVTLREMLMTTEPLDNWSGTPLCCFTKLASSSSTALDGSPTLHAPQLNQRT